VDIRTRVTGYLERCSFKEGAGVKQGDVLFAIDPRPYQAAVNRTAAQAHLAEARVKLAAAENTRAAQISKSAPGTISQQELDKCAAAEGEAQAALVAARAAMESDKLNLEFTKVRAPMDGRVGRRLVDPGNLVKADDSLLATLVSVDPMYVYFNVDEKALLRLRRLAMQGKAKTAPEAEMSASLGLADEDGFPRRGSINWVDNQVDPDTGTVRMRAVFPNPGGTVAPGMFARVRVPIGAPRRVPLVLDEVIGTDQEQRFLYVVDDQNRAVYRRVIIGAKRGRLRVIEEGLRADEFVVVTGLRRVRPGMVVNPRKMPPPVEAPDVPR
jgi:RND family efflux transporter MFP subunit